MRLYSALFRVGIHRSLDRLVKRFASGADGFGIGRLRPIAVGRNDQLPFGINEDALSENTLGGVAAVIIGPPLLAIALASHADVGLFDGCRCQPVIRPYALPVYLGTAQNEHTKTGIVTGRGLNAAAADFMPG